MPSDPNNARDPRRAAIRMTWIVLLCLAAGATANVLVAWGVIVVNQRSVSTESVFHSPWPITVPVTWPARANGSCHHYTGWDELSLATTDGVIPAQSPSHLYMVAEVRAGTPFRSMAYWDVFGMAGEAEFQARGMLDVSLPYLGPRALPLTPLWTGFLANTLVYAFAGFAGVWMVRRLLVQQRIEKNECPGCGYSMVGLKHGASCPECGCFWFTKEDLYGR